MAQNYDSVDINELLEESQRLVTDPNSSNNDWLDNFVSIPRKEGFVIVRLLPPAKGKKFYCATRTHRLGDKNLHCPRELVNINGKKRWVDLDPKKPCHICKYYSELWKKSEVAESKKEAEELQDAARAIKPIERYYYNCAVRHQLNRKGELETNVGPKILSVGKTLHERVVRAFVGNPATGEKPIGNIVDIKEGRDFQIINKPRKVGNQVYANYDSSVFLDPSPLGNPDQVKEWLSNLHDLASLRKVKTQEELHIELQKYLGIISDGVEDTDFDLSHYQKPVQSIQEQIDEVKTPKAVDPTTSNVHNSVDDDQPLDADDILAELNKV